MVEGLVTVVIPVYNVERYLDRCVRSVASQTYTNIEILLIDDGSPDKCPVLCDQWATTDNRIRVIHKKNAGLGYARNTGIDNAKGEYIYFLDSDDYIDQTLIQDCYTIAKQENADIVFFGCDRITEQGKVISNYTPDTVQQKYLGKEVIEKAAVQALKYDSNLSLSACFCFISMGIIREHDWHFVSEREIISEDYYSMLKLLGCVNNIFVVNRVYYHYTINQSSLSQVYRADRYEKIRHCAEALMELIQQMGYYEVLSHGIASVYLGFVMGAMKQIVRSRQTMQSKIRDIKNIMEDNYLQGILKNNKWDSESFGRRLFYRSIQMKSSLICYGVVKVRCIIEQIKG